MSDVRLTGQEVIDLAATIVAEKGSGHVYRPSRTDGASACYYVHGNRPGCLVGQLLYRAGVPLKVLRDYEGQGGDALPWFASPEARRAVGAIQATQDGTMIADDYQPGGTWGDALDAAELAVG